MLKYGSQAEILRARRGNPPRTIPDYPHEQLTQGGTAALRERLRERASALPGVVEVRTGPRRRISGPSCSSRGTPRGPGRLSSRAESSPTFTTTAACT